MLARTICGGGYRSLAARLAGSTLLQWFCRLERMGRLAKIPGKSQLQRYQGMVRESELREVVEGLLESAAEAESADAGAAGISESDEPALDGDDAERAAVYVRGKAGAEVEFGSQLLLSETRSGLIADWELVCGNPEHDTELLKRRLDRDQAHRVEEAGGDRVLTAGPRGRCWPSAE